MKKAGWLKDGIATPRGIVTAHGEMLKRRKMSEAQINEWNGYKAKAPKPAVKPKLDLESMTKDQLEALGREHDIELDKREKKTSLIDVLKYVVKR